MMFIGDYMLVNSKKMLLNAKKNNTVVFQFNINNLEWTKIILEKCNSLNYSVILGVSEGAIKYMGGYNVVSHLVSALIYDLGISIDVCLHLDHGSSFENCKKAIDAGFNSVMIDASKFDFHDNVLLTKKVVDYAHQYDVTVEAEIGHVGGMEDNVSSNILLADYNECIKFVNETGIDSLAPAIGTVHGIYKGELNIDFDLIKKLHDNLSIPLVMHGGSGVSDDIIIKAIQCGINKINVNSDLQNVWYNGVVDFIRNNPNVYDPRKVFLSGQLNIEKVIESKINILNTNK